MSSYTSRGSIRNISRGSIRNTGNTSRSSIRKSITAIKKAGNDAWKWISAEDAEINSDSSFSSYFQRNEAYKELCGRRRSGLMYSKRLSRNRVNNSYLSRNKNNNPYPYNNNNYNNNNNSYSYYSNNNNSYSYYSNNNSSYQYDENANADIYQYYTNDTYALDMDKMNKVDSMNNSKSTIKRPEPTLGKKVKENDYKKSKKDKIPSVLYDPKVRKQLEEMKQHKPIFMYIITLIQIGMMIYTCYKYYTYTGQPFASFKENIMIGPDSTPLIQLGGRFLPCMKQTNYTYMECPKNFKDTLTQSTINPHISKRNITNINVMNPNVCTINQMCGFGMKVGEEPNQWFRFFLPIFLHAGVVHIAINLSFQIRTGIQMERDFGTWRILIIYITSGIFGFAFGANYSGRTTSVGCSGSLYGLLGCLLLDLIQSWRLLVHPWKEFFKMFSIILFSLGIGLLPFIDNFAHAGGFIMGILTGLVFMPSIIFSKRDLRIKRILMLISIVLIIFSFIWVFRQFYETTEGCKWCHYINCIPIKDGWCKQYND